MITRADAEYALVRRAGKLMAAAGLDGITVSGANADLNDPLGYGLLLTGFPVASISDVADADLAGVSVDTANEFLDRAELRLLENILQNYDLVTMTIGPRSEQYGEIRTSLEKAIDRKTLAIAKQYGTGATLEGGAIDLNFQQHSDIASIMILPN